MSLGVLILSIIFAAIEVGISWLLLAFEPVARMVAGIPLPLLTGGVFAIGMLLSYILILIVGGAEITDKAADFVKDHTGRVIALMLISVLLVGVLGCGAEALYQMGPMKRTAAKREDIVFILDYSGSMNEEISTPSGMVTREKALQDAFETTVNGMENGQRICVVCDDGRRPAEVVFGWTELTSGNRSELILQMKTFDSSWDNNFDAAVQRAGELVEIALADRRSVKVLMISDGQDSFRSVAENAPAIISNGIKIDSIGIGDESNPAFFEVLQRISAETGGSFRLVGDGEQLTTAITTVVETRSNAGFTVADTLITPRDENRQTIINGMAMRLILLTLVAFLFKLIVNVCIGNNGRSLFGHILLSLVVAIVCAVIVEFGFALGLPVVAVLGIFWLLMMGQIVIKDR